MADFFYSGLAEWFRFCAARSSMLLLTFCLSRTTWKEASYFLDWGQVGWDPTACHAIFDKALRLRILRCFVFQPNAESLSHWNILSHRVRVWAWIWRLLPRTFPEPRLAKILGFTWKIWANQNNEPILLKGVNRLTQIALWVIQNGDK